MNATDSNPLYDAGIERALRAAEEGHRGQTRKGLGSVPYVLHPAHVALILARFGASSRVIQAAILHDIVEDCPDWSIARVEDEFGRAVASIVLELTEDKTQSWDERKRWQVDHVAEMSAEAVLVKAADKLHNLSCLAQDLRGAKEPDLVWKKFKRGPERTLTMSAELVSALERRVDPRIGNELRAALAAVKAAAGL